mmetsp:Transcript_13396/g.11893  ORF Transcript_13396/g.11893 Transcript_13396/m.11893 type:complete len:132 (-) Transcript_13396:331-726(-)
MQVKELDNNFIKYGLFQATNAINLLQQGVSMPSMQLDLNTFLDGFCLCDAPPLEKEVLPSTEFYAPKAEIQLSNQSTRATRIGALTFQKEVKVLIEAVCIFKNPTETIFYGNKKGKDRINASKRRSSFIGV